MFKPYPDGGFYSVKPNKLPVEHFDVFIVQYLFQACIYKIGITGHFAVVLKDEWISVNEEKKGIPQSDEGHRCKTYMLSSFSPGIRDKARPSAPTMPGQCCMAILGSGVRQEKGMQSVWIGKEDVKLSYFQTTWLSTSEILRTLQKIF